MGFNYSISDNEVCIYRYFPSTNVICVLESLQLDLIELKLFNPEFINLDKGEQIKQLEILKHKLKQKIIKLHDPYMLHIFEELYIDNKNIKDIKQNIFENKKINHNRLKILRLATQIPNIQIKR